MKHLDFGLAGKTVLVTGGAGGIGKSVCAGFAEAGARVAVVDIHADAANEVAKSLGSEHQGFAADLRQIDSLTPLVAEVENALAPIDVLVNIAGIILRTDNLFDVTEEHWDAQHDINLKAVFFLSQAVGKQMIDSGRPGSIVNYSSQGWMSGGFGGSVVYHATKGAITTMTRGMARSWAPNNIRVNAVAPGLVETPMLVNENTTQDQIDALCDSIPMKRLGQPDDHVGATVFLASDMAHYMTGATINVSGGFLMY